MGLSNPAVDGSSKLRQDERFAAMFKDPRFQRFPKKQHKLVIDQRFKGLLQDEHFQVTTVVDKRGRKVAKKKENDDLKRYYRLKDEEEWRKDATAGDSHAHEEETAKKAAGADRTDKQQKDKQQKDKQQKDKQQKKAEEREVPDPEAATKVLKKKKQNVQVNAKQDKGTAAVVRQVQKKTVKQEAGEMHVAQKKKLELAKSEKPKESEEEDEDDESEGGGDQEESGSDGLSPGKSDEEYMWARARGLVGPSESDDDSEGEEEDGDEDEEEEEEEFDSADEPLSEEERDSEQSMDPEEWGVGAYARDPDKDATLVAMETDTRRLAIVDLDWDHVKAIDILAVLRSFCPRTGKVERVTVYPSDYGLQRLAEETVAGPQGIFKSKSSTPNRVAPSQHAGHKGRTKASQPHNGDDNDDNEDQDDSEDQDDGDVDSDQGVNDASNEDDGALGSEDGEDDGSNDEDRSSDDDNASSDDEDGSSDEEDWSSDEGGDHNQQLVNGKARKKAKRRADDDDEDDGGEVDKVRLAMYERSKMRYYYAVAECDTVATAAAVYAECDGLEFERSACRFDLRFVPDEQSFEGRPVRDSASTIPDDYKPPSIFNTSLQHTDPKLTWDADDDGRKRALSKRLTENELKDADFAAYLGSDDSEDDNDQEEEKEDAAALRNKYRSLLLGNDAEKAGGKSWGAEDEGGSREGSEDEDEEGAEAPGTSRIRNEDGMEMEITFQPGLESLGQRLLDKKKEEEQRKGETVWEAYLRKRREKRLKKKNERKGKAADSSDDDDDSDDGAGSEGDDDLYQDNGHVESDPFFQHEGDPFDDPFFKADGEAPAVLEEDVADKGSKKGTKKKGKQDKAAQLSEKAQSAQQQKELELLLMDDSALHAVARGKLGLIGAAAKTGATGGEEASTQKGKLSKKEKRKQKAAAKQKAREGSDEEELQDDGFQANYSDPRFADVLTSHDYAVDPTDPRFKKSKGAQALMEVVRKRGRSEGGAVKGKKEGGGKGEGPVPASKEGLELRAMVAKLKRKSAQMQAGQADAGLANGRAAKQKRVS